MSRTIADDGDMDNDRGHERIAADRLARRVLEGRDTSMSWREAGYQTAEDAARAMVGDGGDDTITDLAVEAVAAVLAADATAQASASAAPFADMPDSPARDRMLEHWRKSK